MKKKENQEARDLENDVEGKKRRRYTTAVPVLSRKVTFVRAVFVDFCVTCGCFLWVGSLTVHELSNQIQVCV